MPTLACANRLEQNLAWTTKVPWIDHYELQSVMRDKVGLCRCVGTQLRLCVTTLACADHIQFEPRVHDKDNVNPNTTRVTELLCITHFESNICTREQVYACDKDGLCESI